MRISFFPFPIFVLISNCFALTSSSKSFFNLTNDQHALFAFKNYSNPNPILLNNWTIHTPLCQWIGVSCGRKHQRVTALNVSGLGLDGTVAPHLANLTFLRSLDISSNNFTGLLPSELSKLRRLQELNVGANQLAGDIPPWLGALSQLRHMRLNDNFFSGELPPLFNISRRLQTLDMHNNIVGGNIPKEIGSFSSLERLSLGRNRFMGSVPDSIFNISSLMNINLGNNNLSGRLPSNICTPKLKSFSVSYNHLQGEIPRNISGCRELEFLSLQINHFSGSIPAEIGSLSMLVAVYLWENQFQGELPEELGKLPVLEALLAANNSLSGSIPPSLFNTSAMTVLELTINKFSGSLPSDKGLSLPNLQILYLRGNRFSGPIPSCITNASALTQLELSHNLFTGTMPNLGNLRLLKRFLIAENNLRIADLDLFSLFTNCRSLELLEVSCNPLNCILTSSVGNLSSSLSLIAAENCSLKGAIPSEIGNLSALETLYLSGNQLTGLIPSTMGRLRQMQVIHLFQNQLQGSIPVDLCGLSNLGDLNLEDNLLTGPLPECFGELKSLRVISLGGNKLNSTLPSSLWDLRDVVSLNLSYNDFSGKLSSQISQMKVVCKLDLSSNNFSGNIPTSIDGCETLDSLNLSNNNFGGSIPQSMGNTRGLETIDLSNNYLSGLIPKSLEKLRFLECFNVSYNSLEGEIPNEGCFVNFTAQSVLHNPALCGAARFEVPPCARNHGRSRSKSVARLIRYTVPVFISGVVLAVIIIVLIRKRKLRKISPPVDHASLGTAWRIISYSEIVRATSSFSETELLGRGSFGSVFKGTLSDGMIVAVKVFNLQTERALKSFTTESKILSNIRHRNLVRVISSCTNLEFKALILEFMPNGSLERLLYSDNHCVDLRQWLNIAIDAALALEYLHHGHTFPVVHCDIKPGNVLLDEDMTARVADFGIAKLFDDEEDMIWTKTLATIGYAAPEYGYEGKVSTSADVYSYGIMLLEMFTRKKPTDDMFDQEMSLKEWVSEALQVNSINEVVAPGLLSEEDRHFAAKEQCVASVFDLAMKCVVVSPNERINMIGAVSALQKIKAKVVAGATTRRQRHAVSIT